MKIFLEEVATKTLQTIEDSINRNPCASTLRSSRKMNMPEKTMWRTIMLSVVYKVKIVQKKSTFYVECSTSTEIHIFTFTSP